MVVAGVHEGKNEINARVGYFNLGINLKTEKPTSEQIKKAVNEVIGNGIYYRSVKELSEEFKEYKPNELFAEHAASLLKKHRKKAGTRKQLEEAIY